MVDQLTIDHDSAEAESGLGAGEAGAGGGGEGGSSRTVLYYPSTNRMYQRLNRLVKNIFKMTSRLQVTTPPPHIPQGFLYLAELCEVKKIINI